MKVSNKIIFSMMAIAGTLFTGCSDDAEMPANPSTPVAVREASNDIIYEVNPRFYGTSGCLAAVNSSLDDIANTGANILWIMPVNEPGVLNAIGSPYCVKDFKAVNSKYGTLEDLRTLVGNAHAKGMKVILDWIANHTSWDCAWITDHKDWYEQDDQGNILSPSGWTDVAELNYDNAAMRQAMIESMTYWIDAADIDGFRFDHVDGVPVDFWTEAVTALRAKKADLMLLAESSNNDYFAAGFDMNYGWNFASNLSRLFLGTTSVANFISESNRDINQLPEGKRSMRYAINHDTAAENTVASIYGSDDALEAAYVVAMMLDGTPMIYSAQEIDYTGKLSFFDYGAKTFNQAKNDRLAALGRMYKATREQRCGELRTYQAGEALMFARAVGEKRVLVIVNTTGSDISVKTPIEMAASAMTDGITGDVVTLPVSVTLGAYGYAVYYK